MSKLKELKINLLCLRQCDKPFQILSYYLKRLFGIRESFNEDMYMDNSDGYFNCGKEMETCKVCCDLMEPEFKEVMKGIKGNVIDCGAHIGRYSVIMAREVGNSGTVYAIEPYAVSFTLLSENIKNNLINNVHIFQNLLFSKVKDCYFYIKDNFPGGNSIFNVTEKKISMRTITLDILLNGIKNINFIKIDVEGGELDVIKGGLNIITRDKPIIYFEANSEDKLEEVTDLLKTLGYMIRQINECNYLAESKVVLDVS